MGGVDGARSFMSNGVEIIPKYGLSIYYNFGVTNLVVRHK